MAMGRMGKIARKHKKGLLIGAGVAAFLLVSSVYTVSQVEQALVLRFGKPVRVVQDPGMHLKLPLFFENVEFYDLRLLDFDAESKEVIAADQKRLIVDAFIRYRITDPLKFKQTVANERTMRSRLNSILESSLRQVIGGIPLSAVVSEQRSAVMQRIKELVNAQAAGGELGENGEILPGASGGFGIEVVDVRIMRADLPQANSESIYRRMQTEREREAKEFRAKGAEDAQKIRSQAEKERTILIAEARKQAEILRGEGDAEAIRVLARATGQDAEFYGFYRTLQAYRKSLAPADTTLILTPGTGFLRTMEKEGQ